MAAYMCHNRRAARKGNAVASRRVLLPSLEPTVWTLCGASAVLTGAFVAALAIRAAPAERMSEVGVEAAYGGKQFVVLTALVSVVSNRFFTLSVGPSVLLIATLSWYSVPVVWLLASTADTDFVASWVYLSAVAGTRALVLLVCACVAVRPPSQRASSSSIREYCAFASTSVVLSVSIDAVSRAGGDASADVLAYASILERVTARFLVELSYILDAARAVAYLHSFSPPFLHREICPSKFVLDDMGNVKLADLGDATRLPRGASALESSASLHLSPRGAALARSDFATVDAHSVAYTPPELLRNRVGGATARCDEAVDVYALAMLMWDVLHPGCERFPGLYPGDTVTVARGIVDGRRPQIDPRVHPDVRQLIESAWAHDARLRPTVQYIVSVLESVQEEAAKELAEDVFSELGGQFSGEEAVQFLMRTQRARGKAQALRLGNALMDAGLLHHVNHSKGFEVCKYGVYCLDEAWLSQQQPTEGRATHRAADSRCAAERPQQPRAGDAGDSNSQPPVSATARAAHRVESFEPDQLRLIDSTLCACRRLGQRMEEPAKLVRRTRRPTRRLLEEENSLTADLLTGASESV
ncbi:hypothetical protein PybrP1_007838 [[Pythium] brassicae (nom. inval.)]|nr:hypothetical protein PybrP1_007838 [[Pythium] brassicae (nom. inval.)]